MEKQATSMKIFTDQLRNYCQVNKYFVRAFFTIFRIASLQTGVYLTFFGCTNPSYTIYLNF